MIGTNGNASEWYKGLAEGTFCHPETRGRSAAPGNAATAVGAQGLLRRLIPKVWAAFRARVRVVLDGGFATPALFDELEPASVEYVVAMAKNRVARGGRRAPLAEARTRAQVTGASARVFGETPDQAKTWSPAAP